MVQTTSVSLLGQAGKTGDDQALFLKMFAGEVLTTFRQKNIMMGLTRSKNVGAGKSHQFPAIGEADAAYHAAGQNILDPANNLLTQFENDERTIQVDRLLMSNVMIDNWDELITHYGTRSEMSGQLGLALSNKMDRSLLQLVGRGSRSGVGEDGNATLQATQDTVKDGFRQDYVGSRASSSLMIDAMVDVATNFAEKDVPMDDTCFVVRPAIYFALQKSGELLNVDFGNAGNGSQASGTILRGYGFRILWSNHIPSSNIASATTGENNNYFGDFSQTQALAFHRSAIASVVRQGVTTETDYRQEFQGTLVTSKIAVGHGILRPEACAEIFDSGTP